MTNEMNNLDPIINAVLESFRAISALQQEAKNLRIALHSLQTVVASLVDPANAQRDFQQILDQEQIAISRLPKTDDEFSLVIQALKNQSKAGQA